MIDIVKQLTIQKITYLNRIEELNSKLAEIDAAINTIKECIDDCFCPVCHGSGIVRNGSGVKQSDE